MAKHKSPSVLNSRVIRINIGDYMLLTEISRRADLTFAEALHLLITNRARQDQVTVTPRTQIPMLIGTTAFQTKPQTAIATNGSKVAAFRIRPKGVRHD